MELIDFAEQQGMANFNWQQRVNETTRNEANITLGFLAAGGSACIAWAVSNLTGDSPAPALSAASLGSGVWLFGLAAALQFTCLDFMLAAPPANHPLNLYKTEFSTLSIREINLQHLESAILASVSNGQRKAKALLRIRYAACFTPLVFLAAWAVAAFCCSR